MLVRGTYKQIARASWQNPKLRKELQVLALKNIDKECHELCSRKRPSCLRSPSKEQLQSFSFEKFNNELENRAPFMKAILHAACVNNRNASRPNEWMPTICMAAAVLLRNRSSRLNAVQLLLSIFLYHSSWTVSKYNFLYTISSFIFKSSWDTVVLWHKWTYVTDIQQKISPHPVTVTFCNYCTLFVQL